MAKDVYDESRNVIFYFLMTIIKDCIIYSEHARRKTITSMDVVLALKRHGKTFLGFD